MKIKKDWLKQDYKGKYFLTCNSPRPLKTLKVPMSEENIKKILQGTKTSTLRGERGFKQIGLGIREIAEVCWNNQKFSLYCKGFLTVEEAGGKERVLKTEGVKSENEFKYKQTKDWINGKGKLYYYNIKRL